MKIALLTWFQFHNYGSALQVTALSRVLQNMGHEVYVIDYQPILKQEIFPEESPFRELLDKVAKRRYNKKHVHVVTKERKTKFEEFLNKNLLFTIHCDTLSDLQELNRQFDLFVCGSDQIWTPRFFDRHYFLDFVTEPEKMIAYAPSIGTESIENKDIEFEIQRLTKRFRYLSVREQQGADLLEELLGRKVETVLDPTFLLDKSEWEKMAAPVKTESPYLLCYFLDDNSKHWKCAENIAKQKGLRQIIVPVFQKDLKDIEQWQRAVGPEEFLGLIQNADYICTDSFHGTVFSILFQKSFSVFERFSAKERDSQNSRVYNILKLTGMQDRLITYDVQKKIKTDSIDFLDVNRKIKKECDKSQKFLNDAIRAVSTNRQQESNNSIGFDGALCSGCGACAHICPVNAIKIIYDESGFYQAAVQSDLCINCGKCQKVCPFWGKNQNANMISAQCLSYKSDSQTVLNKSSSGGFANDLALCLMEQGYCICGCMFDSKQGRAKHVLIEKGADGLKLLQGSKYMQSDFSQIVDMLVKEEKPVAVFALPCQIAGIRKRMDQETVKRKRLYVDLICHGVPSGHIWEKYLNYLEAHGKIHNQKLNVTFRSKKKDWHEKAIHIWDDAISFSCSEKQDLYLNFFTNGNAYAKSCYECRYRDGSMADIRIGDYWGEKFKQDKEGVSMVLALTEAGEEALNNSGIKKRGVLQKQDVGDYFLAQQVKNSPRPVYYHRLMDELQNGDQNLDKIYRSYVAPYVKRKKINTFLALTKKRIRKFAGIKNES